MNQQVPSYLQNQTSVPNQSDFCLNQQRHQNPIYVPQHMNTNAPLRHNVLDQNKPNYDLASPVFIMPQQQFPQPNPFVAANALAGPPCVAPVYVLPPQSSVQTNYLPYPLPLPTCNYPQQDCQFNRSNPSMQPTYDTCFQPLQGVSPCFNSEDHRCFQGDGVICVRKDCPAAISLQALASQFLSVQGIVSCAATRILLKRIPGSNIFNSDEEIMDRAQKTIDGLTKDQLLTESRNCLQLNALINLHMSVKPPLNVIPVLTLIQLKINSLKTKVESNISQKIMVNK